MEAIKIYLRHISDSCYDFEKEEKVDKIVISYVATNLFNVNIILPNLCRESYFCVVRSS